MASSWHHLVKCHHDFDAHDTGLSITKGCISCIWWGQIILGISTHTQKLHPNIINSDIISFKKTTHFPCPHQRFGVSSLQWLTTALTVPSPWKATLCASVLSSCVSEAYSDPSSAYELYRVECRKHHARCSSFSLAAEHRQVHKLDQT